MSEAAADWSGRGEFGETPPSKEASRARPDSEGTMSSYLFPEPFGQGSLQFAELGLALVLSALIGRSAKSGRRARGCALTPRRPRFRAHHAGFEIRLHRHARPGARRSRPFAHGRADR